MKRHFFVFLSLITVPLLFSCGSVTKSRDTLKSIRSNEHVMLIVNTFDDEGIPGIAGSVVPIMLIGDSRDSSKIRGFAIDCAGNDPRQVYAAFGIKDTSTIQPTQLTYTELVEQFEVDKQPILKCSSVINPQPSQQQVKAVFRVIQDGENRLPYPDYLVKFAGFEHQFYSVGCQNFLDTFGFQNKDISKFASPVLASSLDKIFLDLAANGPGYKEINCISASTALPTPAPLESKTSAPFSSKTSNLYKVTADGQKKYVLVSNELSYEIRCPSVPENEMLKAFRFNSSYQVKELAASDPLYINAARQPALRCKNPLLAKPFENVYRTKNENPGTIFLRAGKNDNTLLRFGCSEALTLFPGSAALADNLTTTVTRESIDYLTNDRSNPSVQTRVLDIPCAGGDITAAPDALKDGEVISLQFPVAANGQLRLDANTSNGSVFQTASENTGSFWYVAETGESNSFLLQSLGYTPNVRYLACSNQNNQLLVVKNANQSGYETKWSIFRGENGLQLACRANNGKWRWLNGASGNPLLSGDETVNTPATTWTVTHHRFDVDTQFFKNNDIVSFFSLLIAQDKRWLAGYPGGDKEVGLETSSDPNSTYFQVQSRSDGRGISLRSLNSGSGDQYLDCRTEADKLWYELAPETGGIYRGTAYKVYRLSGTSLPIVKLACFDDANTPYWMGMTGNFPWMDRGRSAELSHSDAILYSIVRDHAPGASPREQIIPQIDFIVKNTCGADIPFALLYFGTNNQWNTQTWNLRKGTQISIPVRNQYTYWYGDYNVSVNWSDVQLLFNGTWKKTVEFNHNYQSNGHSSSWINQLLTCAN